MCGIVGAVSTRNIVPLLVQGLQRLEYRGYDSCGIVVHAADGARLQRVRGVDRVAELADRCQQLGLQGQTGIAHTRWATHGAPAVANAHPHVSYGPGKTAADGSPPRVTLVHNGIIENHEDLRAELIEQGYHLDSQTDTETIVHLIDHLYDGDLLAAVQAAVRRLHGSYSIAVLHAEQRDRVVGARQGSPLVLGIGRDGDERFLSSDAIAMASVTDRFIYLDEGDVVELQPQEHRILDVDGQPVERQLRIIQAVAGAAELGPYRHFMQKETFEQPRAVADTLEDIDAITPALFEAAGGALPARGVFELFSRVSQVRILACGTSYYAGSVARYWMEALAAIPCQVEIASEFRYRDSIPDPDTLVVTISQSGETADTLSALRHAASLGMEHSLTICNSSHSTLVRESRMGFVTRAGVEIGVASTKAFTTQLVGLFLLTLALAKARGRLSTAQEAEHLRALRHVPAALQSVLALEPQLMGWAERFATRENALFLGRNMHYPIAQEGALKLKETSYIHAEAYAAGELKHGPLALITDHVPVVVVAPNDALLQRLKSNMEEVRARGGVLYALADADTHIVPGDHLHVVKLPGNYGLLSPILHVVPLQLLAYHTAVARGTDVDKPRNLAKAVTVE